MTWLLPLFGLGAGLLSTIAGLGGGMLLVLALSALIDPRTALATTTPALLGANLHRAWMYRRALDRRVAGAILLGAFPGALLGSLVAVAIPEAALPWLLLAVAALAVVRELGWVRWDPSPRSLGPVGFASGAIAATSGGMVVSPMLLAAGVRGDALIGTASATAMTIHVARTLGYGLGGWVRLETLASSALLLVGLLAGNLAGKHLRARLGDRTTHLLTYAVLVLVVALAIAGVA